MNSLIDFIGKFHPLLLHLPIGVLIYAYLHLSYDLIIKKSKPPVNIKFALGVGATSAILSALSGYFLSLNGSYSGDVLNWHKWLGLGTALGAVLLYWFYDRETSSRRFLIGYTIFMGLLIMTGHYGGSLTHGEDFLSLSDRSTSDKIEISDVNQADIFQHLIMPIVERKCISCHNESKLKGGLLMTSIDGWKKGGKTGKFLIPGDHQNSLISLRAHLPLDDKEHMPPSGKLQLDKEEILLMDWWVSKMNHYSHKVEDLFPPVHIMKYIESQLDYSIQGVPELLSDDVLDMQSKGIPVHRISEDKPWLAIQYTRGELVDKSHLNLILDLNENIREIKMSKVGLTNDLLSKLSKAKNLKTLDVSLNKVSVEAILKLSELEHLETLNLYGTDVDAKLLKHLDDFESLKNLYLWQTSITRKDLDRVNIPQSLNINIGQDLSLFGEVQLSPPTISGSSDIFVDTLQVSLLHQGNNVQLRYTLDGTEPTEASAVYQSPIILKHTALIKATASMDGWKTSMSSEKSFLRSAYKIASCEIDPKPNEKYKADGNNTIIDLQKASSQFGDGKWLGFSAQDISIAIDLGKIGEVSALSFGSLRDYRSYIFNPIGAKVSISEDGELYTEIRKASYTQITKPEDNLVKNIIINIPKSNTRFIKLEIEAQKQNPDWHPNPGADCWLFIDEVVIE